MAVTLVGTAGVFIIFAVRLVGLQLVAGGDYFTLSSLNHLRKIPVPAPRGCIYDRRGHILAGSKVSYDVLWMLPQGEETPAEVVAGAARLLGMSAADLRAAIAAGRKLPYEPATVMRGVPAERAFLLEEARHRYPAVAVVSRPVRHYPYGSVAAHLLGYIAEIDKKRLAAKKDKGYRLGDYIGWGGVEDTFEYYLRGQDGYEVVAVDALEQKLGLEYGEEVTPARPGCDVHLTIDLGLQRLAEEKLAGARGAIVVMDPRNGDVLALASSPAYDPNVFVSGITAGEWAALAGAADHPLLNRAVQCAYPPGSTFKLVTATAALEEGLVEPDERMPVPCTGVFPYGTHIFHCWNPAGHGYLDVAGGLRNSCNVFFFQVGLRVGIDNLTRYARRYRYGMKTGIALPHEAAGLIPSRARLERKWGHRWPRGEVLNNAVGQGQVLLTPIQELCAFAAFANGGKFYRPRLVTHISRGAGRPVAAFPPEVVGTLNLKPATRATILRGLLGVVNRLGSNEHFLAGKTGSAENPFGKTHAWFVGFAPAYDPRLAVCILVENGGYGESYIKWAKEIVGYGRREIIGEGNWPAPPVGLTAEVMEKGTGAEVFVAGR